MKQCYAKLDRRWSVCIICVHQTLMQGMRWTCGTYGLQTEPSTLRLTKVNPFWSLAKNKLRTHKGTMDAMTTTKGDVWVDNLATIFSIKPRLQGPPERVFSDCNKESDETLRQVLPFIHVSSLLIEGWGTRERVSPSTCHLDSHTSSYGTSGDLL